MNNIHKTSLMKKNKLMQTIEIIGGQRTYTLNGEEIPLETFIVDNEDTLEQWELLLIASLDIGEHITFGGGASPVFTLKRTK